MRNKARKATKKRALKGSRATPRELQVLRLVATGLRSDEIAAQLKITTETVKGYRVNLLRRLDARNVVELLGLALKKKLIRKIG